MAPALESLPKKLAQLQQAQSTSTESQPAAKKMPAKVKPVAVADNRTVPPPPPPLAHGGKEASRGDVREDPGN
eukprot:702300-Amphidinium_carterae.1